MKVAKFTCRTCKQKVVWPFSRESDQCAGCIREDEAGEVRELRLARELSGADDDSRRLHINDAIQHALGG